MREFDIDVPRSDGAAPTPTDLLRDPLVFIAEDHMRARTMCATIDAFAAAPRRDERVLSAIQDFFADELMPLIEDESCDLVPLLAQRAEPEDDIPRLRTRLAAEHAALSTAMEQLKADLSALPRDLTPSPLALRRALRDFTADLRRHLILENAILVPLARARFSEADLDQLRASMLARRGLNGTTAA